MEVKDVIDGDHGAQQDDHLGRWRWRLFVGRTATLFLCTVSLIISELSQKKLGYLRDSLLYI
jgi:hypothetical protein